MMSPNWSKLGSSSRRRGHSFERKIARRMNELLGSSYHFNRTPASGGHAIKGDIYEDPKFRTEWSNVEIYCRTSERISLEALMCDKMPVTIKWIEETGPNSVWIIRSKPNRVFFLLRTNRVVGSDINVNLMKLGKYTMFDFEKLPFVQINLSEMEK